ncbi:MAG TPA: regulatory protein RecX [Trueperaceae bacterium]|nr:regulatory protein RecX [Trueperaceae bacterium]
MTREGAWEYLLRVLARQSYTVAELRRKLKVREVPDESAEELLARLQDLRLVDDAAYAEQYVASRKSSRGRLALSQELRRKGIAEDLAAQRVGTLTPAQQLEAATVLLTKNSWRYRPEAAPEPAAGGDEPERAAEFESRARLLKARAKALGFLARRGFAADVAVAAIEASGWFEDS